MVLGSGGSDKTGKQNSFLKPGNVLSLYALCRGRKPTWKPSTHCIAFLVVGERDRRIDYRINIFY